jgi:ATP-dependent Clp protease ATP-binding subunit ClpB
MKTEILKSGASVLSERPDFNLIARETELSEMINILGRRFAHNVLLTGQGGSGCSALCLGLQQAKSDPKTPFEILHKRIWWLDTDGLFSNPDKTSEYFDNMIKKVSATTDKDTILIIEDTRNFIEASISSGNGSFINRMMRNIEQGRFQVIFEVRDSELDMVLNSHGSMHELFTIMEVSPPANDNLHKIVSSSCVKLHKHHGITIEAEAVEQAIYLTTTYPGKERSLMRSQPEASLTLLDRALATYKNTNHSNPSDLAELNEQLKIDPTNPSLIEQATTLASEWDTKRATMASSCESQASGEQHLIQLEAEMAKIIAKKEPNASFMSSSREEQELALSINQTKALVKQSSAAFEELSREINSKLLLTADDVFNEFSRLSGIPFDKLNEDESEKLLNLPTELKKKIFGQDHVIDQLSDALLTARTPGLKDRGKPDAAFMFCGSSGVGKTALAKALAGVLKDDEQAMLRFDMSEYSEKNNVTSLIGAPPGYAGFDNGGVLTNAVRKNPNSIILFDEIEKADPSIFDIFLQVLDDGRLTDTQGRTVSFEHTILIFTTNTGAEHMLNPDLSFEEQFSNTLEALGKEYRAEFLNRFGGRENIVAFKVLPKEVIRFITRCQLDKVNADLAAADVTLELTMGDDDIYRLCEHQYKPERGARGIDGTFRTNVYPRLARMIKTGEACDKVNVTFIDNEFALETSASQ